MKNAKTAAAAAKRDIKNTMACGSNGLNSRKEDSRSKTVSGSKDLFGCETIRKTKKLEEQKA